MAEQKAQDKEKQREATEAKPAGGRKGKLVIFGVVGGVMLIEAAAILLVSRFLGGPSSSHAGVTGLPGEAPATVADKEIVVSSFRAMNDRTGHNIIYDVKVYARVNGNKAETVQKLFEEKKASIEDRMAKVIRAADPQYFREPGLDTLRRQIKYELDRVVGDGEMLQEVIIPSLMWYNADG